VVPGVTARFFDAGHIFGSAMVFVTARDRGRTVRIAFTGDHGRKLTPILRDPERLPECDVLITESTYGDREHEGTPDIEDQLAGIVQEEMRDGGRRIALLGESELTPIPRLEIPGDISSAAFPLVGAAIRPGSELRLEGVGVNPLRTGLLEAMQEMGAQIRVCRQREMAGEPVADLEITASDQLTAVDLDPALAPRMIDEFPVLFVAAACADGCSRFRGLGELRVKESDRLAVMAQGLAACGVRVEEVEDGLVIHGSGRPPPGGARIDAHLDHRIAMSFLVLGLATQHPVAIEDAGPISTSFPGFSDFMTRLGARMTQS